MCARRESGGNVMPQWEPKLPTWPPCVKSKAGGKGEFFLARLFSIPAQQGVSEGGMGFGGRGN